MRRGVKLLIVLCMGVVAAAATRLHASPLSPALTEAWTSWGTISGEEWGGAVAGAGDVNGDGYDDIVVGAPKYGPNREGGAFVYYGGPAGLPTGQPTTAADANWGSTGEKGSRYGNAVAAAGDLNCDGYDDLAVGAPEFNNGTTTSGAVFIFYGSEDGLAELDDWRYVSEQSSANLGYAVAGAGDVNRDGCDDLLVGVRRYSNVESNEGALFLFYGSEDGLAGEPDWYVEGTQPYANLGSAVAGLGDVNGDGYDDIAGGAPFWSGSAEHAGALYVYYGGASGLELMRRWSVEGTAKDANLGWSVATAGDVNGDDLADLVAGMPGHVDEEAGEYGAVLLFHGRAGGLGPAASLVLYGDQPLSHYGWAAAGTGDMNSDGYGDLLTGASRYTRDQSKEGAVFLHLGGPDGLASGPAWVGEGNKADADFGYAVAGAGDVNGDGGSDFLVGAPLFRNERIIVGRAYAYHGAAGNLFYSTYLPFLISTP